MSKVEGLLSSDSLKALDWLGGSEANPFLLSPRVAPTYLATRPLLRGAVDADDDVVGFTYWSKDFSIWAPAYCAFSDSCTTNVAILHRWFGDWCVDQRIEPISFDWFTDLLRDEGFCLEEGWVHGLILNEDWAGVEAFV